MWQSETNWETPKFHMVPATLSQTKIIVYRHLSKCNLYPLGQKVQHGNFQNKLENISFLPSLLKGQPFFSYPQNILRSMFWAKCFGKSWKPTISFKNFRTRVNMSCALFHVHNYNGKMWLLTGFLVGCFWPREGIFSLHWKYCVQWLIN